MSEFDRNREMIARPQERALKIAEDILRIGQAIDTQAATILPKRCRALILNKRGTHMIVVHRVRQGEPHYTVIPGGGVEPQDASPADTMFREVSEELSISPTSVGFDTTRAIELDDQWIYLGIANDEGETLAMGGPELDEIDIKGTQVPGWIALEDVERENFVPLYLRELVIQATAHN